MLETAWVAHFSMPVATMGMKTVTLNDIEGVPRVGVVLRIEGLPADLPWSRVMMYSKTQTEMKVVLLGSGAQLRDGHARSVYTHRVNKRTQERSALLRTGTAGLLKTPTYEELLAKTENRAGHHGRGRKTG